METLGQNIIEKLCRKHQIKLTDVHADPSYLKRIGMEGSEISFKDRSYCAGGEVFLGIYEDPKKRFISFLHEFAHIKAKKGYEKSNCYETEKHMWKYAFRFAKRIGFEISDEVFKYCDENLQTYEWHKITREDIKGISNKLHKLGYNKEADKILNCDCDNGCERCCTSADKYKREILDNNKVSTILIDEYKEKEKIK